MMQFIVFDIVSCSKIEGTCSIFNMDNLFILQHFVSSN